MKLPILSGAGVCLALLLPCPAHAAGDPAAAEQAPAPGEPVVRRTVIEDDGSRIEELKVRGETQRVTVTTKGPLGSRYDILVPQGGSNRGDNAGRRVWSVMAF
jgi:hypothetical protein